MTNSFLRERFPRILRHAAGVAVCLLAIGSWLAGMRWYESFVVLVAGIVFILGRRRIFRPGVTRTRGVVVCHYVPWYEGNVYFLDLLLPLMALAIAAAGGVDGNPPWLRFIGILLLALTPLFMSSAWRMWRRSSLTIAPSTLTLRMTTSKDGSTEVHRECVESIEPKVVPNGVGGQWPQVEIAYRLAGPAVSSAPKSMLLGLQITVQPADLLDALVAWRDNPQLPPDQLLDRVERLLRGERAGVAGVA